VKIIVGLGNPGTCYQWTRHNIGFQVVDRLAEGNHLSICHKRFKAQFGKGRICSQDVLLIKPLTYMNLSGLAIQQVVRFYKVGPEDLPRDLIVIHDDLDLPFGAFRIKRWGGDGGHQGVRSVIESLGDSHFLRLKVGIGRPLRGSDPAEYVLNPFDGTERNSLDGILSRAAECVAVILSEGVEAAMNRYQKKLILPSQSP
jgi:peptidyl-tRNA hydrolase, PTH1 family